MRWGRPACYRAGGVGGGWVAGGWGWDAGAEAGDARRGRTAPLTLLREAEAAVRGGRGGCSWPSDAVRVWAARARRLWSLRHSRSSPLTLLAGRRLGEGARSAWGGGGVM